MTVRDVVTDGVAVLTGAGFPIDDARIDASVLGRHALGWTLADWAARARESAPDGFAERFRALIARRATREPVAYITGTREFFGRPFMVRPGVLIPRPETELIVEEALRICTGLDAPVVHDIGTGSGCLAISIALECQGAIVLATDISSVALGVACANASSLGAANVTVAAVARHEFVPNDAPDGDVIVTNPPYVAERDRSSLAPDVINYEPPDALFGGEDGLDVIRDLIPAAAKRLKPGGWLLMEIGAGQAEAVSELLRAAGLQPLDPLLDLQAIPRVVRARRA